MLRDVHAGEHGGVGGEGLRGQDGAGLPAVGSLGSEALEVWHLGLLDDGGIPAIKAEHEDVLGARRGGGEKWEGEEADEGAHGDLEER